MRTQRDFHDISGVTEVNRNRYKELCSKLD